MSQIITQIFLNRTNVRVWATNQIFVPRPTTSALYLVGYDVTTPQLSAIA